MLKQDHTREDLDFLIKRVSQEYAPQLKQNRAPKHCGLCGLYRFCQVINHTLICPWS